MALMNSSQIHRARLKRVQELAIEFSPDEDIRSVLSKSATETPPDADGVTLSHRAERRVRRNAIHFFFLLNSDAGQAESQASEIEGET